MGQSGLLRRGLWLTGGMLLVFLAGQPGARAAAELAPRGSLRAELTVRGRGSGLGTDSRPARKEDRASGTTYVDAGAAGGGDGTSWADAYRSLSAALETAGSGDEIWVAAGVYTPTTGVTRTVTFELPDGVAVYGGFAGTETTRRERDWEANASVLSGDIDGNDATDSRGVITHTGAVSGANAFHVVTASGVTEATVLDGFTINGGQADGTGEDGNGGGIYCASGSPTLRHLVVVGNCAVSCGSDRVSGEPEAGDVPLWMAGPAVGRGLGGGIYALDSSPVLSGVVLSRNKAVGGGGMHSQGDGAPALSGVTLASNVARFGGGVHSAGGAPVLHDVVFDRNRAFLGGGMYDDGGTVSVTNTLFSENEGVGKIGGGKGGGMYSQGSSMRMVNAVFQGNGVEGSTPFDPAQGGAVWGTDSSLVFTNATLHDNRTDADGAGGGIYVGGGGLTVTNTILWENQDGGGAGETAQITAASGGAVTVTYSLLQGAATYAGPGVIDADPSFVDPVGDLRLRPVSPAIDAGDNGAVSVSSDLEGNPRRVDVPSVPDTGRGTPPIVDMGAYEAAFVHVYVPLVVRGG